MTGAKRSEAAATLNHLRSILRIRFSLGKREGPARHRSFRRGFAPPSLWERDAPQPIVLRDPLLQLHEVEDVDQAQGHGLGLFCKEVF